MPKSRSKRSSYTPPTPPKPKSSPRWLPWLGLGLIILGILLVVGSYLVPGLPGGNITIVVGFVLMGGGLLTLSQYR